MMKFSKEIKIALAAIVGIVVLFFGLQYLKGMTIFSTNNQYFVKFKDVSGLTTSIPIYANGYRVGVVEGIEFNYKDRGNIIARIGIDNQLEVSGDSRAEIVTDIMGNVKVDLLLGSGAAIAPGDTILGCQHEGALGQAAGMVPQIEQMLPKLDSILASINLLLADPAIASSLHNIDHLTADLAKTSRDLNVLTTSLNSHMPKMLENADGLLANTNQLTQSLNDLDIAKTMASVNTTLKNVEQMTEQLNSKEGTLGLLMRDPSLYSNLNATMMHADSLMIDLKAHPKRYVHFSVFGKKDK